MFVPFQALLTAKSSLLLCRFKFVRKRHILVMIDDVSIIRMWPDKEFLHLIKYPLRRIGIKAYNSDFALCL